MSESDLERELHRRGEALIRKLLQGHLDQRSPGEAAGPVEGADGVERPERRVHERHLETTFGTVQVERLGYVRPGHDSRHPLDAALNLPVERYSLEVRRRVAEAAASRSYDEALFDLSRHTGAEVPKRQAEQLVVRAAEDFDALLRGAPCGGGRAGVRGVGCGAHLRRQGGGAASRGPARGDAQGGREAPAAPGAALPVQAPQAGREEALEAHGDGGRRLRGRAVRAEPGGVPGELDAPTAGGQDQGQDQGSPELTCWTWTRVRDILEGKARRVAASMRRAATVAGFSRDTRKPVDTCADYLLKYAPYLHYDRYLAADYPIATGVIEGACRHLVRERMELTGPRNRPGPKGASHRHGSSGTPMGPARRAARGSTRRAGARRPGCGARSRGPSRGARLTLLLSAAPSFCWRCEMSFVTQSRMLRFGRLSTERPGTPCTSRLGSVDRLSNGVMMN